MAGADRSHSRDGAKSQQSPWPGQRLSGNLGLGLQVAQRIFPSGNGRQLFEIEENI